VADAEIVQLGSRGAAGRGSASAPSAAARGLAAQPAAWSQPQPTAEPAANRPEPIGDPPVATPKRIAEQSDPNPKRGASTTPPTRPTPTPPNPPPGTRAPTPGRPRADGPPDNAVPPALDLPTVITELFGVAGEILDRLKSVPIEQLRDVVADPLQAVFSIAESLGVDWQDSVDQVAAFARARMSGDYTVDEFGFDPEFTTKIFLPLLRPLVKSWFRVEVRGVENLPGSGSALLVSNHAGTMPLDGMVLHTVIYDEIERHVRMLGADLIFSTPFSHDLARKTGTTLACQEDAERLLAANQLVAVFPEGFKGLGKPYADRYKLQRFGRGGFVSAAVRAQVPIIPVSIVGSEEIYPLLASAPALARAMGVPYFPVTPLFPWLGVLGLIPLPSKWIIEFGEAIATDELPLGAADDPMIVFNVTDQVRETIQHTLYALLLQRRSAFF
jgi:1-acyl-sn-glycerol-3-phosphate acyltransferase